jgi:UDP-N-acetylmuramate--alanine ligase
MMMERPAIPVHTQSIKAAHKVEVVKQVPDETFTLRSKRFHLIGVGGVGMSALAQLLIKHQALVSGSDMHDSDVLAQLKKAGARIFIGHHKDHIHQHLDAVVVSAAVKQDNPELRQAQEQGCTIYKYAQM